MAVLVEEEFSDGWLRRRVRDLEADVWLLEGYVGQLEHELAVATELRIDTRGSSDTAPTGRWTVYRGMGGC